MGKLISLDFLRNKIFRIDPLYGTVFPKNFENLLHNVFSLGLLTRWCAASVPLFEPESECSYSSYVASRVFIQYLPQWVSAGSEVVIEDGTYYNLTHNWLTVKEKDLHYIVDVLPRTACYPSLHPRMVADYCSDNPFICPPFAVEGKTIQDLYASQHREIKMATNLSIIILNVLDELGFSADNCMLEGEKMTAYVEEVQRRAIQRSKEENKQG